MLCRKLIILNKSLRDKNCRGVVVLGKLPPSNCRHCKAATASQNHIFICPISERPMNRAFKSLKILIASYSKNLFLSLTDFTEAVTNGFFKKEFIEGIINDVSIKFKEDLLKSLFRTLNCSVKSSVWQNYFYPLN
jgi:hypothetical protein